MKWIATQITIDNGRTMLRNNIPKQRHIAKLLFLSQLGRFDQHDTKNGKTTTGAFRQNITEAIADGARVVITLPAGTSGQQDRLYEAWQGKAEDQMHTRFATHEFNRRQVNESGKMTKPFHETRLKGANASKTDYVLGYDEEKPTGLLGNYGMNIAIGGIGTEFNGNDMVDDQGRFGHLYQRVRKGDKTHCGTILFGFENSAPHGAINIRKHFGGYDGQSMVGQTHNSKAVSHDTSLFLSTKEQYGDKIGGREVDLSHVDADALADILTRFDIAYEQLQNRANAEIPDFEAIEKLHIINEKLTGEILSANGLYDLLRFLGIEHDRAKSFVGNARSLKDCAYANDREAYPESLFTVTYAENEIADEVAKNRFFTT